MAHLPLNFQSTSVFHMSCCATVKRNLTRARKSETHACTHNREDAEPLDGNKLKMGLIFGGLEFSIPRARIRRRKLSPSRVLFEMEFSPMTSFPVRVNRRLLLCRLSDASNDHFELENFHTLRLMVNKLQFEITL